MPTLSSFLPHVQAAAPSTVQTAPDTEEAATTASPSLPSPFEWILGI